jgi:hypothetical protein
MVVAVIVASTVIDTLASLDIADPRVEQAKFTKSPMRGRH